MSAQILVFQWTASGLETAFSWVAPSLSSVMKASWGHRVRKPSHVCWRRAAWYGTVRSCAAKVCTWDCSQKGWAWKWAVEKGRINSVFLSSQHWGHPLVFQPPDCKWCTEIHLLKLQKSLIFPWRTLPGKGSAICSCPGRPSCLCGTVWGHVPVCQAACHSCFLYLCIPWCPGICPSPDLCGPVKYWNLCKSVSRRLSTNQQQEAAWSEPPRVLSTFLPKTRILFCFRSKPSVLPNCEHLNTG